MAYVALAMGAVVAGERAGFAVFEPFPANLVGTDMEIPNVFAHVFEAGGNVKGAGDLSPVVKIFQPLP